MVKNISDQRHQLEVKFFGNGKALGEGHIMHMHARPFENVDTAVAVPACRWIHEAGGVKPALDGALTAGQVAVADAVRQSAESVCVGRVGIVEIRREVLAGL